MPTYQTTPLGKWKFPDEIYRHNQKGYGWAGVGTSHSRPIPESGTASPWADHERQVALDRLKNNKKKMLGMLHATNTTARTQAHDRPSTLSQTRINGKFHAPASDFEQTAGGLRGGTQKFFYTAEAQTWLENWRKRRIGELNAISKDDFSAGPPQRIPVAPQYNDVDAILAKVLDQFEAGAFSSSLVDDMNKLQGAFLKIGSTITAPKLAQYMRVTGDLRKQAQRVVPDVANVVDQLDRGDDAFAVGEDERAVANRYMSGTFKMDAKDKKVVRTVALITDRLVRLLDEINKFVNDDPQTREMAMEEIGSRILGSVMSTQAPFGLRQTQRRIVGDVANRPTEAPPVSGELAQRELRIPQQRPPAELETLAGTPPVKPF